MDTSLSILAHPPVVISGYHGFLRPRKSSIDFWIRLFLRSMMRKTFLYGSGHRKFGAWTQHMAFPLKKFGA